jgi:hypothetical protein
MLIVNEAGTAMVNTDQTFLIGMGVTSEGEAVLLAQAGSVSIPLATGGDRPQHAAEAIMKAHKERWLILDLNDLLGAKPDLVVPQAQIIRPGNGQGH